MSILLIGKKDDFYFKNAKEFVLRNFSTAEFIEGTRGQAFPEEYQWWEGQFIISYLSPWIIPNTLLKRASVAAINFHPGPPEYPGIGCTNFAIYNSEKTFGITCHHMDPKVDTGKIIAVRRFPLFETDTVYSLTQRCYAYMQTCFYDIVSQIAEGKTLPDAGEPWKRIPYKRIELNELCRISPEMSEAEIQRRVKAVTFPGMPGAYTELAGKKFLVC